MKSSAKTNVQVFPTRTVVIPNDRVSKKLFNLTTQDLLNWIEQQKTIDFTELLNHKRFGDIISPMKLTADGEHFTISEPLDPFDRAVLAVCISEWIAGNRYTTPAIIYRALTGKVGRNAAEPSKNQLADILNSIKVLMRLQLEYDLTNYCESLGYKERLPAHLLSAILPCHYLQAHTINGQDATVIYLDSASPLLQAAQIKNNQLLSFDSELLDVPHQHNTRMNISLKFYVIIRVLEIKLHKMTPTITFADAFEKCRLQNSNRKIQMDARETIITFLEHLQDKKVIHSFELIKKGNAFHSVTLKYTLRSKSNR